MMEALMSSFGSTMSQSLGNQTATAPGTIFGSKLNAWLDRNNKQAELKKLFPGASTWDLLGGSGAAASIGSAGNTGDVQQMQLQREQMQNQKDIAQIQADSNQQVARITTDPAQQEVGSKIDLNKARTQWTIADVAQIKARVRLLDQQQQTEFWATVQRKVQAKREEDKIDSEIHKNYTSSLSSSVFASAKVIEQTTVEVANELGIAKPGNSGKSTAPSSKPAPVPRTKSRNVRAAMQYQQLQN
jgi:hypothetical protein